MSVFALDTDGDLSFVNGRLVPLSGAAETAHRIDSALGVWRGEWFLDERVGFPGYQVILGTPNPDIDAIKSLYREVIRSVQGVKAIEELTITFDRATRKVSPYWRVKHDSGATIVGGIGEPFIVEDASGGVA